MLVCGSSTSTRQYHQDILRALALPKGSIIQLRYSQKWIESSLLRTWRDDSSAVIACVDYHKLRNGYYNLIPCRQGRVVDVDLFGSVAVLKIELSNYVSLNDSKQFNERVTSTARVIPPHKSDNDEYDGYYWFSTSETLITEDATDDVTAWEYAVTELTRQGALRYEPCYYFIKGLVSLDRDEHAATIANGYYVLQSNRHYALDLYYYHPSKVPDVKIYISTTSPYLDVVSRPVLFTDCCYDLKRIVLATNKVDCPRKATVMLDCTERDGEWTIRFDVPVEINNLISSG